MEYLSSPQFWIIIAAVALLIELFSLAFFAMLGDVHLAEPEALIGFAGPRVIRETIKRDLPEGFQTAEYLLENGFVDLIVNRKDLQQTMTDLLQMFSNKLGK